MKTNQFRFSSSYSVFEPKQNLSTHLTCSTTHFKTQGINFKSSSKQRKCKCKRKSSPHNSRSRLLKTFNYINPVQQIESMCTDICLLKLNNEILKAKVINENVRKSKQKTHSFAESFLSQQKPKDEGEISRRMQQVTNRIAQQESINEKQQSDIAILKQDIRSLIQENKKLRQKVKLKIRPSHTLDALLTKLRD